MKRVCAVVCIFLFLTGCGKNSELDKVMNLRDMLLKSNGCTFDTVITADYGEHVYTFSMQCQSDEQGMVTFTVTQPETISGISGSISADGGKLTFNDQVLAFQLMADGQVTPVSAPWLFIQTLRSGYLTACGKDGEHIKIAIDDSYEEDALHLDIWTREDGIPIRAEVLWQGRRVLSLDVNNFVFM